MKRLVLLVALVACKKAQPDEDPGPQRLEGLTPAQITAFTDHALEVYDALATAGERAGTDCDRMATDLAAILEREGETLQNAVKASADPQFQEAAHDILEARAARTTVLTRRMEVAFEACAADPEVEKLLLEIE